MQWIKSNLVVVIAGSLALISLLLLGMGMFMSDLQEAIAKDASLHSQLRSAANQAVNPSGIERVRAEQLNTRRELQQFLERVAQGPEHEPLVPGVFPASNDTALHIAFMKQVREKRQQLLEELNAKDRPSQTYIEDYKAEVERQRQKERLESGEGGNTQGFGRFNLNTVRSEETKPLSEMTPEEVIEAYPESGAAIKRAHELWTYANYASLDSKTELPETYPPYPSIEQMWMAQVSLWVQEDLIQALDRVNTQMAGNLQPEQLWVANMPVKHLLYIALGDYVPQSAASTGGMRGGGSSSGALVSASESVGPPPLAPEAVFTQRGSTDQVDVLHVALGLVVDARNLQQVLDSITRMGFYTPLTVTYEMVEYDPSLSDYIYGPGPIIQVRIELECCMLRSRYEEWMPEAFKSGQPVSTGGGGGGYQPGGGGYQPGGGGFQPGGPGRFGPPGGY